MIMNITWEHIADCLRNEVQEYGDMLRLFEEQQECVFNRDPARLLQLIETTKDATQRAEEARRLREECVSSFASGMGRASDASLRTLLPIIDDEARPLLQALIEEVNRLIHRVRRITRQNHLLLSRTVQLHQGLLRQFYPGAFTSTYSARGRVSVAPAASLPAYRAAG
jgi:flagellar biosynthesis/type III secretory pathway chaperone